MKMKKIIILLIAVTTTFTTFAQKANANSKVKQGNTVVTTQYICPMHPEVAANKPGKCSKCNMDLIKGKDKIKS